MRKYWSDGTVACREINSLNMLAFMPYAVSKYNMYDYPAAVYLVNLRNVSTSLIPATEQIVNKDVVLGWCSPSHKPIFSVIKYYVDRIAQVEMVINTNLNLHKMPFLVGVTPDDKKKMEDIIDKILNNELVVFADLEDLSKLQSLVTATPYIIDKLQSYLNSLVSEALTFLGVDNVGFEKAERLLTDEVNGNNDLINAYGNAIEDEINKWLANINRIFGRKITIKRKIQKVESISETGLQSGEAKSHPQAKEEVK